MNRQSDSANSTFPSLSFMNYELDRYIYISYTLSLIMYLYSAMAVFFYRSFWLSEASVLFAFTVVNHAIAFHSRTRLNRLGISTGTEGSPLLRPRSTISERLITSIYLVGLALTIVHAVSMFRWYYSVVTWRYRYFAAFFEHLCLFIKIPLMIVIGWWTVQERRAALDAIRSYDLPR